ncbi:testis-expressed protein 2 isoform X2 [Xenopus tropicalis]|uniref:Testis-expressed protein 2 isoform X2 n=1 Tax=Xenopus tropicalis TaxID=8364 RepID=A0A8J0SDH2_XENTR|nr:testis-expressed protein 2 isoform X2 [Xenopus tropicalis]|eukprot:XP_012810144.1 PREDICTED: testis-expressed sequence 2 protein isoform X2 [Xenopus tropicalis]
MTSVDGSHADKTRHPSTKHSAPKVEVHRSVSRETITIHFSAAGKEEEEEEEEFKEPLEELDDQSIVTGEEAMEDLYFDPGTQRDSCPANSAIMAQMESESLVPSQPTLDPVQALESLATKTYSTLPIPLSSSSSNFCPNETNMASPTKQGTSVSSSPSRLPALSSSTPVLPISSAKPFMSLVKSLSTEGDPKEPSTRHRHLMKTLVKSLSTDTSKQDSESFKATDSKLNLHLFKQFTQPRITGGDSKTAPSSPITSPSDGRSFFKVIEVEAKIEDTKRRLSEVIYEPFQLLSKIIGEEPLNYRPKALSSSASELSNLSSLNGHLESNNYSIKEEEGDVEADCSTSDDIAVKDEQPKASGEHVKDSAQLVKDPNLRTSALALEKCSLSALASKEDEEFTELYSEDFDFEEEAEAHLGDVSEAEEGSGTPSVDEGAVYVERSEIPVKTLYFFVLAVYGYQTLPLPSYLDGLFLGVALGFMAAICVIWLFSSTHPHQHYQQTLKVEPLQISEPDIMKGWMNEIHSYNPETYHATLTHSIFVRLEGSTLRLSKPNKNVSRRAMYNEAKSDVVYISQKIYDLVDSKVHLVPKSLARKRVWNKKYPICLELARQDDFMAKAQADREGAEDKVHKGEQAEDGSRAVPTQDGSRTAGHREQVLYLFGRTGREKEEWFRKFLLASKMRSDGKKAMKSGLLLSHSRHNSQSGILCHSRNSSRGSLDEVLAPVKPKEIPGNVRQKSLLDYNVYMARCIPPQGGRSPTQSPAHSANSSPTATKKVPGEHMAGAEEKQAWVNALLGRMFWDFLGEKYWSDLVSKKIQMKLSKIKLPYFMNELTLTELDMGVSVPKILQAFEPTIDHRGLWTDLDISYTGSFLMTLETKMNLTKLGKEPISEALKVGEIGKEGPRAYYLADSDEESSSAGSSDEDDGTEVAGEKQLTPGSEGYSGAHRTSKIMRFVDKITKSKYFQKATETEFIKKKIEEVSNTPLLLTVEVQECQGTLAINIPPPPTDRIWYGFRKPPHLELKARPKLGEREVTLAHVTDWIERKLEHEFQKIFVMPNMDDLYVPIMHSAMDPRSSKEADLEAIDVP